MIEKLHVLCWVFAVLSTLTWVFYVCMTIRHEGSTKQTLDSLKGLRRSWPVSKCLFLGVVLWSGVYLTS